MPSPQFTKPPPTAQQRHGLLAALICSLSLVACGGGSSDTSSSASTPATPVTPSTPTTPVTPSSSVDPSKLPLGDSYFTASGPQRGYAFLCSLNGKNNGFGKPGPWFNADGTTWDSTKKVAVSGSVSWPSSFSAIFLNNALNITGNGLPNHGTGVFPVAANTAAYQYDKNPNNILSRSITWNLPANPQIAASPTCLPVGGSIGIMLSGASLYNAADADIRDGVAWEVQDSCQGHPQGAGQYHYHSVSSCLDQGSSTTHAALLGYIADGFGIYGNRGENGTPMTNADLDECHGHSHSLTINGAQVTQYHYHATKEFPYAVGCYKGTPVSLH